MGRETYAEKRKRWNKTYADKQKAKRRLHSGKSDERLVPYACRLPESLLGRIQRMVNESIATGKYPWKRTTDCFVALVQRGFLSLKGDPFIDEMAAHVEMTQHLDRLKVLRNEAQITLGKARTEITELLGIGANSEAVAYYHVTMDAARKMPPTIWRDWVIKELRKSFPDLAKQKPQGVSLNAGRKRSAHD